MLSNDELNDQMLKDLDRLGRLRIGQTVLQERHDVAYEEFKAVNAELIAEMGQTVQDIENSEKSVREAGKELYGRLQTKKLSGGVGIRVGERLKYAPDEAFRWAMEHRDCLQLDKKQFEAIAKVRDDLPFVTKEPTVTVTIPSEITLAEAQVVSSPRAPVAGGGGAKDCPAPAVTITGRVENVLEHPQSVNDPPEPKGAGE